MMGKEEELISKHASKNTVRGRETHVRTHTHYTHTHFMALSCTRVLTSGRILLARPSLEGEEEAEPWVRTLKRSRVEAPAVKQTIIKMQKIHHEIRRTRTEEDIVERDTPGLCNRNIL